MTFDPIDEIARSCRRSATRKPYAYVWAGSVLGFAVANAPADRLALIVKALIERLGPLADSLRGDSGTLDPVAMAMDHIVVPLKAIAFLLALAALLVPLVDSIRGEKHSYTELPWRRLVAWSLIVFLGLCLFALPIGPPMGFTAAWGRLFSVMSLAPFAEPADVVNRRLLFPALAYFLNLRGLPLFLGFTLFDIWLLVLALFVFFHRRSSLKMDASPGRSTGDAVRAFWLLSIGTSSFVMANLQFSGFVDHFAVVITLFVMAFPLSGAARLSCLSLGILTHEASVFMLGPLIFLGTRDRSVRLQSIAIPLLYAAMWVASYRFDVDTLRTVHGAGANPARVVSNPALVLSGVLVAFKLLWLVVPAAIVRLFRERRYSSALAIALMACAPLPMFLVASDVSRLTGHAFPAVLLSLALLMQTLHSPRARRAWTALFLLNLLIPSYWVQSNGSVQLPMGLYKGGVALAQSLLAWAAKLSGLS